MGQARVSHLVEGLDLPLYQVNSDSINTTYETYGDLFLRIATIDHSIYGLRF